MAGPKLGAGQYEAPNILGVQQFEKHVGGHQDAFVSDSFFLHIQDLSLLAGLRPAGVVSQRNDLLGRETVPWKLPI